MYACVEWKEPRKTTSRRLYRKGSAALHKVIIYSTCIMRAESTTRFRNSFSNWMELSSILQFVLGPVLNTRFKLSRSQIFSKYRTEFRARTIPVTCPLCCSPRFLLLNVGNWYLHTIKCKRIHYRLKSIFTPLITGFCKFFCIVRWMSIVWEFFILTDNISNIIKNITIIF